MVRKVKKEFSVYKSVRLREAGKQKKKKKKKIKKIKSKSKSVVYQRKQKQKQKTQKQSQSIVVHIHPKKTKSRPRFRNYNNKLARPYLTPKKEFSVYKDVRLRELEESLKKERGKNEEMKEFYERNCSRMEGLRKRGLD